MVTCRARPYIELRPYLTRQLVSSSVKGAMAQPLWERQLVRRGRTRTEVDLAKAARVLENHMKLASDNGLKLRNSQGFSNKHLGIA
jgi:hypothetical protein